MSPFWRRRPREEPVDETLVIDDLPRREEEEVVEEERAPAPPPRIWPWLLALLLLVLAGGLAYWLLARDDDRTTVPRVVGMTEDRARTVLAERGLEVDVDRRRSDRDEGVVFAQSPGAGTQVAEGETVEIAVSAGRQLVSVPAVRDLDEDDALRRLQDGGFEAEIQRVFAGAPVGQVVEQDPRGGERAPEGSTVELIVSRGRNLNEIPDVVGRPEAEAVRILRERDFAVRIFDVPSAEPRGRVVAQSPPAGEEAPPDSRVRINVSTGESGGEPQERTETDGGGEAVEVPRIVGLAQTPALRRLLAAGLRGVVAYRTSDQPAGRVIEQNPAAGTQGQPNARVQIVVSAGTSPETLEVPDVRGSDEEEARQLLEDEGFRVEVIGAGDGTTVRDQQPAPGVTSFRNAVVTLIVG